MTSLNQNSEVKTSNRRFQRILRALCVASAFGGVVALAHDANAEQRCTSKPAVCALQKAKAAQRQAQTSAPVAVEKAEVKQVVRIKRCNSKPAVCALQRSTEPQTVTVTQVVRKAPAVKQCTSKPAVCALQRSQERAKNRQ